MVGLRLQLLGRPAVCRADETDTAIPLSLQPFLGYLCVERPAACHRERMIDALWPDLLPDQSRRRLNTAVWRARALFDCGRDQPLRVSRAGGIVLDRSHVEIDIEPFVDELSDVRQKYAASGDSEAIRRLGRAVLAGLDDFLVGCYDDWVVQARHQLHLAIVRGLETLIDTATDDADVIRWAELLIRRDPLREDVHRLLIHLYAKAGRRADALRQYDDCERVLLDELGVEPLVETSLLAAAVRTGLQPMATREPDSARALQEIRTALASCRTAVEHIERALALLPAG
jgi:DNA-binding SARP family transcriptional activator